RLSIEPQPRGKHVRLADLAPVRVERGVRDSITGNDRLEIPDLDRAPSELARDRLTRCGRPRTGRRARRGRQQGRHRAAAAPVPGIVAPLEDALLEQRLEQRSDLRPLVTGAPRGGALRRERRLTDEPFAEGEQPLLIERDLLGAIVDAQLPGSRLRRHVGMRQAPPVRHVQPIRRLDPRASRARTRLLASNLDTATHHEGHYSERITPRNPTRHAARVHLTFNGGPRLDVTQRCSILPIMYVSR